MTRKGMEAADEYGRRLPTFSDQESAERALYRRRDELLEQLARAARESAVFDMDHSAESLKALEGWYFELWEAQAFESAGIDRVEFECCMAMYLGELLVRNVPEYDWVVEEFAFLPGRFELGVARPRVKVLLGRETDHYATPNNKRRQSLWRKYRQWAG